jgi:hypothetical protein
MVAEAYAVVRSWHLAEVEALARECPPVGDSGRACHSCCGVFGFALLALADQVRTFSLQAR